MVCFLGSYYQLTDLSNAPAMDNGLHPAVGEALLADEKVLSLMQQPKLAGAIKQLKEQPDSYAAMLASDPELAQLFEELQQAMNSKEAEHAARRSEEPPPLKAEDEAEADQARAEGAAAFEQADFPRACERYERAASLRPANHVHWSNLAVARLRNGETSAACDAARKCIELNPRFAKGHLRLGEALHASGMFLEAIDAFERGLQRAEGGVRLALIKVS